MSDWIKVDCIEDIELVGVDIVVWDGCDKHIDYVEISPDTGNYYMANGTGVTHYLNIKDPED